MGLVQIPDEEEIIEIYPTLQIQGPVLPEDYPLFDWKLWPGPYAALKQGEPTRKFRKDCWNYMMETMENAARDAGFYFFDSEAGYGEEDILILQGRFGRLTADRMNAVVAAFDKFLPWEWVWKFERDPPYPESNSMYPYGYWWRSKFYGRKNKYGYEPDVVYPEYITGLARRVNMCIELMRGTYPTVESSGGKCQSATRHNLPMQSGMAVLKYCSLISRPLYAPAPVRSGIGLQTSVENISELNLALRIEMPRAGTLYTPFHHIYTPIRADGESKPSSAIRRATSISGSKLQMVMEGIRPSNMSAGSVLMRSKQKADMGSQNAGIVQRQMLSFSRASVGGFDERLPVGTGATVSQNSDPQAEIIPIESWNIRWKGRISSRASAGADTIFPVSSGASAKSSSRTKAGMAFITPTYFGSEHRAVSEERTEISASLAMYANAWKRSAVQRKLTIIQSRTWPMWADGTSESQTSAELEFRESAAVATEQGSTVLAQCSIGSAWDAPLWHDGGLWIRQARTVKMKPDGSMDLSGSGDPFSAAQYSETIVIAAVGNGWLAPVWHDGGLYIRQVRQADILEDGALDLTGAGDEMLVHQKSRTNFNCTLDTAWEPPVMLDGGLLLRQARLTVQLENKQLEVY